MTLCYVVPGFLSSDLVGVGINTAKVWINYTEVLLGQLGKLRLAANGIDPGPPDGVPLLPGGPLTDYWPGMIAQLGAQLGSSYVMVPWGYDWRKELYNAGVQLAASIVSHVPPGDPCSIVAHSTGGLVARAAWTELGLSGHQNLVRRIVTLATPHQGTYAAAVLLSGATPFIHDALVINLQGQSLDLNSIAPGKYVAMTNAFLAQLGGSWPATYQLLPVLGSPDSASDPQRGFLFASSHWNGRPGVSQTWLDYANGPWNAWQLSPGSMPPEHVLTTVAGNGVSTWSTLSDTALLGLDGFAAVTWNGDGIVTESSALVANSERYQVSVSHNALPSVVINSGQLAAWILDPRSAPVPPPPVTIVPGVGSLQVSSVVAWAPSNPKAMSPACAAGACGC